MSGRHAAARGKKRNVTKVSIDTDSGEISIINAIGQCIRVTLQPSAVEYGNLMDAIESVWTHPDAQQIQLSPAPAVKNEAVQR